MTGQSVGWMLPKTERHPGMAMILQKPVFHGVDLFVVCQFHDLLTVSAVLA